MPGIIQFCIVIFIFQHKASSSEVLKLRGIQFSKLSLYNPEMNFTCLDNMKVIPFSYVNDDYCDCLDASDEPGTSACAHGSFFCINAGFKSKFISSNKVNDHICDCCDGSDEFSTNVKCSENCEELGKLAREQSSLREELVKLGNQLRKEWSQKGIQDKQKKKEELSNLENNRLELERLKIEKEKIKNEAEELEKSALSYFKQQGESSQVNERATAFFDRYDENQDGRLSLIELEFLKQSRNEDAQDFEEKIENLFKEEELDLENFINNVWPHIQSNLNLMPEIHEETNELKQNDSEDDVREDSQTPEEDEEELEQTETTSETEVTEPIIYDEETEALIVAANEARKNYLNAESALKEIDENIREINEYMDKDFGLEEEYAGLHGQCFDYIDHEYIYEFCPFDKIIQKPKSGSLETRLGTWGKWLGSDYNKYGSMMYDRGQACWNGPQRSTTVKLSCNIENRIISVTEPNKCEYVFEFQTPASCNEDYVVKKNDEHDEL